jgi:hypothetical protein
MLTIAEEVDPAVPGAGAEPVVLLDFDDRELLAVFDAITAAEWPELPPRVPRCATGSLPPPHPPVPEVRRQRPAAGRNLPPQHHGPRPRAPPPAAHGSS